MKRSNHNTKTSRPRQGMPIYASAWVALYFLLRDELAQARLNGE